MIIRVNKRKKFPYLEFRLLKKIRTFQKKKILEMKMRDNS